MNTGTDKKIFSQADKVLTHLKSHKTITSTEAYEKYRISRLAAVIAAMKKRGHRITSERIYYRTPEGIPSNYSVYRLKED